jgi:hypothetical protein
MDTNPHPQVEYYPAETTMTVPFSAAGRMELTRAVKNYIEMEEVDLL